MPLVTRVAVLVGVCPGRGKSASFSGRELWLNGSRGFFRRLRDTTAEEATVQRHVKPISIKGRSCPGTATRGSVKPSSPALRGADSAQLGDDRGVFQREGAISLK